MDQTIDAISERLSLRHMTERARDAVVRRAPTPPGGGPSFYQKRPVLLGTAALAAGIGAGFLLSPPETRTAKSRTSKAKEGGMVDRAKGTYREARDQAREAASGIAETAKRTFQTGKEEAKDVASTAREEPSRAKEEAKDAAERLRVKAKSEAERHGVTGEALKQRARETKPSSRT